MFHDEDIDQEFPLFVEDENLTPLFLRTTSKKSQNPMKAAVFQIRCVILSVR